MLAAVFDLQRVHRAELVARGRAIRATLLEARQLLGPHPARGKALHLVEAVRVHDRPLVGAVLGEAVVQQQPAAVVARELEAGAQRPQVSN